MFNIFDFMLFCVGICAGLGISQLIDTYLDGVVASKKGGKGGYHYVQRVR